MIRLAAAEDEPGFFCSYLGWTVAWSSMCVDDADADLERSLDDDVAADVEQELRESGDDQESVGRTERPAIIVLEPGGARASGAASE